MVHNGIEYAVMQIMAEAYDTLRKLYGLSASGIADIFEEYSKGKLNSYLFDISLTVLRKEDSFHKGEYFIDFILDRAGQKGTGKWTVIDALERGIAVPSIAEAVFARNISANKKLRTELSTTFEEFHGKNLPILQDFLPLLKDGLYASILSAYAQGYDLITQASREENWEVNLAEVSRIWEGGCIIRAEILSFLHEAFLDAPA
jgi:6-phosphogluconate dehydrogenase